MEARKLRLPDVRTARARIAIVCLLLLGHTALFPLYAVQPVNEDAWVLADETEFLGNPDRYLDGPVEAGGIVQDTDPVIIRVNTTDGTERVTITGTTIEPNLGDKVRVYGMMVDRTTIDANNATAGAVVRVGDLVFSRSVGTHSISSSLDGGVVNLGIRTTNEATEGPKGTDLDSATMGVGQCLTC